MVYMQCVKIIWVIRRKSRIDNGTIWNLSLVNNWVIMLIEEGKKLNEREKYKKYKYGSMYNLC